MFATPLYYRSEDAKSLRARGVTDSTTGFGEDVCGIIHMQTNFGDTG